MANSILRKIAHFDAQNREAAAVILADVEKHGGEGSCSVRWARTFMARMERERSGALGTKGSQA